MTGVREFLAAGVAMIPIPLGEKGPRTKNWQRREQVVFGEENAYRFAGMNAGLAHEWSRTCAIDIDAFDDADAWLTLHGVNLEQLFCVDAAVSVSSGLSNHGKLLFRLPEGTSPPATCKVKADDDRVILEFRCAGSQDVIAGKHPSGTDYSVTGNPASMPTLPDALWQIWQGLLRQPNKRPAEKRINGVARIASGGRNDALTSEAGKLRRIGLGADAISAALQQVNLERCDPPLDPQEITAIANSIGHYAPSQDDIDDDIDENLDVMPRGESALELMEREMPLISYLNEPWIPEGLNLLAGRPKIGKTTMQRQKLAAVAEGGLLFGETCRVAPCAYLSLEEGDRLTRQKLESAAFSRDALANITLFFQWRRGADGVLDLLRLLELRPELRYVAIDSLTKFRSIPDQRTPAFVADYEAVSALHGIAKGRAGLCIDVVHHTRKAKSEDPVEDISGTFGVSAACDSYWVMRHHEDGAVLHVGGRLWDRDVSQFQLRRAKQRWKLVGEFNGLSDVQFATLEALKSAKAMTPTDCAKFWNISRQSGQHRADCPPSGRHRRTETRF